MTDGRKSKDPPETDPEQSEAFRAAVCALEAAGELIPTEAEKRFEASLGKLSRTSQDPS